MENKYILAFTFIWFGFSSNNVYAQYRDSLIIEASLPHKIISKWDDFSLTLKIQSKHIDTIYFPQHPVWGYIQDSVGYLLLEVQQKLRKSFKTVDPKGLLSSYPVYDSLASLKFNDIRTFNFSIGLSYHLEKGDYRIRVYCRTADINKIHNLFSNWFYFYVPKKLYPPSK